MDSATFVALSKRKGVITLLVSRSDVTPISCTTSALPTGAIHFKEGGLVSWDRSGFDKVKIFFTPTLGPIRKFNTEQSYTLLNISSEGYCTSKISLRLAQITRKDYATYLFYLPALAGGSHCLEGVLDG